MKQVEKIEYLCASVTKITVLQALGLRIDDQLPEELTPDQFVRLQAGLDPNQASEWAGCLERSIQTGKLVVRVETKTDTQKVVTERYQLTSMLGRKFQFYKTEEKEVTTTSRWLTRDAVSDWLLILEANPSDAMKFWLDYLAKLITSHKRQPLVAKKSEWHCEWQAYIQKHGEHRGALKIVAQTIADRERVDWRTVKRYLSEAKKEATSRYGSTRTRPFAWHPQ